MNKQFYLNHKTTKMKTKQLSLVTALVAVIFATSCKKETHNYYNCDEDLVSVVLTPNELVVESKIPLKAQVSKTDAEGFEFTATKPSTYYAYFIVGNEVVHKFDQLIEGAQEVQVQNRPYDKIIVSSIELPNDVLRNYNNEAENHQKLIYHLPVTSDKLILVGEVYNKDIRQERNITVTVENYYAVAIFFNATNVYTQDDVKLKFTAQPVKHHIIYIKDRNALPNTTSWNQGFKYQVANSSFNITPTLEVNRVHKFWINTDAYGTTDGNFTIVVGELFVKPVEFNTLPGRQ